MNVQIADKPAMVLVGVVGSGASVGEVDIAGLWQYFESRRGELQNVVEGTAYEVNICAQPGNHFTLAAVEVTEVPAVVPADMFIKPLPPCSYAIFTHEFADGGFSRAFENVYSWLEKSEYKAAYQYDIQCYDRRFKSPEDPESVIEIRVPVAK